MSTRIAVCVDQKTQRVFLVGAGGAYQAELDYFASLGLSALLARAAEQIEPAAPVGKSYQPVGG